jgi:hypothetical protein
MAGRREGSPVDIDRKYVDFMKAAAHSYPAHDAGALTACCDSTRKDPIAVPFCALVHRLLSDHKDTAAFLQSMPKTDRQLEGFLLMDIVTTVDSMEAAAVLPELPVPDGLVEKCIDELFALIETGNQAATERYFYVFERAGGQYAEYMDDQLAGLFREHPERVLALWPVFKAHAKALQGVADDISPAESQRIATKYKDQCKAGDNRCAEIGRLFQPR